MGRGFLFGIGLTFGVIVTVIGLMLAWETYQKAREERRNPPIRVRRMDPSEVTHLRTQRVP